MRFLIGVNIANSRTAGTGREMSGVGEALNRSGDPIEYFFGGDVPIRSGRNDVRVEFPVRLEGSSRVGSPAMKLRP